MEMPIKDTLIKNLRRIRKERGLTQAQFAELVGISHSHVRQAEVGQNSYGWSVLDQITSKLNVSANELFREEFSPAAGDSTSIKKALGAIPEEVFVMAGILGQEAPIWESIIELMRAEVRGSKKGKGLA